MSCTDGMLSRIQIVLAGLILSTVMSSTIAYSDEGMWLFTNPPRKVLKEKYKFEPSDEWLKNVQQSAVRFNSGGSGAFISREGLVITNHHVGADALQKLSTPDRDLVAKGFFAKTREDEIKCVDLGIERAREHRRCDQPRERRREARHERGRCPEGAAWDY